MSFLDGEIIDALAYHLREEGTIIRHNETYSHVEPNSEGVILHLNSGKKLKTDIFFYLQMEEQVTPKMGLEELGITIN